MADDDGGVHDWSAVKDDDGQIYYHNSKTDETSWDPPPNDQPFNPVEEEAEIANATANTNDEEETKNAWVEYTDEDKGEAYYFNTVTQETSWEKPPGFVDESSKKEEETEPAKEANKWVEVKDDEGRTYYFNETTEETSWDRPAGFAEESSSSKEVVVANGVSPERPKSPVNETETITAHKDDTKQPSEWVAVKDDEGRTYYYNETTEETSWDKPDGFDDSAAAVPDDGEVVEPKEEIKDTATDEKTVGDWVETQDEEGRTYYYNETTEETSWDRPAGFTDPKEAKESSVQEEQEEGEEIVTKQEDATKEKHDESDWVELQDDEGRTYYYNEITEETSWDRPAALDGKEGVKKEEETSDSTKTKTDESWVELQDEEGRTYYYNEDTQETTWDRPAAFISEPKEDTGMSPVRPKSPVGDGEEDDDDDDDGPLTAGNWTRYKDEEGRFYYYNAETEETDWDKPADFDDLLKTSRTRTDSADDDEADGGMDLSPTRPQSPEDTSPVPMEEEEPEEEVVDPAVKRLEEAKEALSQSDAIMETGILTHLTEVVKSDQGNPKNAIQALSESAHGQTAVCGLLGRWLADLKSQTSSSTNTTDAAAQAKRFQKSADDIREMTQEVVNRIVKERFTHKGGDNILALSKSEAAFLEDMMDSNRWRKLLIDLSATNKDSALLMYCLQSISKRGHHREIARRINQSEHFPVFNAMLASELAVIGKISVSSCHDHDTSISLNELVGDLRRICTSTSYTYLYGFEVLRFQIRKAKSDSLAMPEKDRLLYQRVIRKWEKLLEVLQGDMIDPSTSTGETPLFRKRRLDVACTISDLHQRQRRRIHPDQDGDANVDGSDSVDVIDDDRRNEIETAVLTFLRKYCLCTHLDDPLLDKMLPNSSNESETKFIGNLLVSYPITIEALLGYLYKPGQRVGQMTMRKKCARLTALAVLAAEKQSLEEARKIDSKLSEPEVDEETLGQMLLEGSQLCEQLENMVSFIVTTEATKTNGSANSPGERICNLAVKFAPVSQGVAMWAREITRGGEFVSSASYASISPNIMTLARIVYMHHPFTRDDVCTVAFQFLKHSNSEAVYHTMNTLKEQSLRLLLFLCTRGEAPMVFDQLMSLLKDPGRSGLDASLIRYFVSGLLEIANPPFSIPFIRSLMMLLKAPATVDALKTTYFDKDSKKSLVSIMNYLRTRTSGVLDARPLAKQDLSLINAVLSIYSSISE